MSQGPVLLCILALTAFCRPNCAPNASKIAISILTECRNICSVTVTGCLCQSVELVQRVTVTGVTADHGGYKFIAYPRHILPQI